MSRIQSSDQENFISASSEGCFVFFRSMQTKIFCLDFLTAEDPVLKFTMAKLTFS